MAIGDPRITANVARILRYLLNDPHTPRYATEMVRDLGLSAGTIGPTMRRLENAGWITSTVQPGDARELGHTPRRYFALEPSKMAQVRAAVDDLASKIA